MAVTVVPVIYDHLTKKALRWYLLDFASQLSDPAFNPKNHSEGMLYVPMTTYKMFGHINGVPALTDIQNYVIANAP